MSLSTVLTASAVISEIIMNYMVAKQQVDAIAQKAAAEGRETTEEEDAQALAISNQLRSNATSEWDDFVAGQPDDGG